MKLTLFTDYAIRTMLYLTANADRRCSIGEIARAYGISQNHLMKVANQLANLGYVDSVRGRTGGLRLGRPADQITVGQLVRDTEDGLQLVDCSSCALALACGMTGVLREAMAAFLGVLDRYTLADLAIRRRDFAALFSAAGLARIQSTSDARPAAP
jgi:Rrf2 family transcriptional regulator, nitric oxide-sensitive transcriptional repressor